MNININAADLKTNDEIWCYKKLVGAIGCYIPTGRPHLGKRFEAVEDELRKQKDETADLKEETAKLKEPLAKQIQVLTRFHLVNFKNQVS